MGGHQCSLRFGHPLIEETGYPSYNKPASVMFFLEQSDVSEEYIALLLAAEFGSNGTKQSYVKQMAKVVAARRRTESRCVYR